MIDRQYLDPQLTQLSDAAHCQESLLVILPSQGNTGFFDMLEEKSAAVERARQLRHPVRLLLAYPPEEAMERDFSRFFDSPRVAARNRRFAGCFGIDVSSYAASGRYGGRFLELIAYMRSQPEIVFVLFARADREKHAQALQDTVERFLPLRVLRLEPPTPAILRDYTLEHLQGFFPQVTRDIPTVLEDYFAHGMQDFDAAKDLVRRLRQADSVTDPAAASRLVRTMCAQQEASRCGRPTIGF